MTMPYKLPVIAFFLCLALTPVVRLVTRWKGWLAYPTENRWHKKPTSLLGGVAIFAGFAIPLLAETRFTEVLAFAFRAKGPMLPSPSIVSVTWIGAALLFVLGLLDDFIHIKPHTKLVGQILAASLVTFLGFRLHWVASMTIDTTLTILWIVGITNAFNLLDNMDGLCAGIGLIAAAYFTFLPGRLAPEISLIALVLVGTLAAFLFYNFNPATIFMGDCGSMPIGFVLAVISLFYAESGAPNALSAIAVPIMILMVPIFDTTLVTLIRILSGRKASVGGKDHTSHRLVLMGLSEKGAVLFLYGIAAVAGLSALFVDRTDTFTSPAVMIPLVISFLLMGIYLAQLRVYPEKEFSLLRDRAYTPVLIELTYKRQMLLVLLDFFLIAFAYYLSYRLRFASEEFGYYFKVFLRSLPAVIACKFVAFFTLGIYRGIWHYMSANDIYVYLKASTFASILSVAVITYMYRFQNFSKGIFLIDWFLITGLLIGTRGSFRIFSEIIKRKTLKGDSVVIYGAGRGGEILLREIMNNSRLDLKPVGYIDDDPMKVGKRLQGYPVLGSFKDLDLILSKHPVDGLLISFNHKDQSKLDAVKNFCREKGLFLKGFSINLENLDLEAPATGKGTAG